MTYIEDLQRKKQFIFGKLDSFQYYGKNLNSYIIQSQYVCYAGIAIYFVLTMIFQENPYTYSTGIITPFITLIKEIISPTGTHMNLILNRGLDNGGHVMAYSSILLCAIVARMFLPKTIDGFYYSILIPAFALSVSEGIFNIFYYSVNYHLWPYVTWDIFILTNPLAIFYIITVMLGIFVTPITKYLRIEDVLLSIGIILFYFVLWTLVGFPVTLSSINYFSIGSLDTVYFNDLLVNLIEIGQWMIASFTFCWCLTHVKKWYGEITLDPIKPIKSD